jgi:hypothetical protein
VCGVAVLGLGRCCSLFVSLLALLLLPLLPLVPPLPSLVLTFHFALYLLSVSLSVSVCLSVSLSISLSVSLCLSVYLSLSQVDAVAEPELARQFDVTAYPTLRVFRGQKVSSLSLSLALALALFLSLSLFLSLFLPLAVSFSWCLSYSSLTTHSCTSTPTRSLAHSLMLQHTLFYTLFYTRTLQVYDYEGERSAEGFVASMKKYAAPDWKEPKHAVIELTGVVLCARWLCA